MERTVGGYFDNIEDLIERENTFTMEQFANSISKFLTFLEYKVLVGKGHISTKAATAKAETDYAVFNKTQEITSDFNREVREAD